jgi:group I intron endonuclease
MKGVLLMECKSGVYKILNLINGKIYVGSSVKLKNRRKRHFYELRHNRHGNDHLQRSFNKYGEENFQFSILEYVADNSIILQREQHWIDFYKSYDFKIGYNICPIAGSNLGRKNTEETKLKISKSIKELCMIGEKNGMFGKKHSEESLIKMRIAQSVDGMHFQGRFHSNESKEKMRVSSSGEKSATAVLNNDQVKEIKLMIFNGKTNLEISKIYNVMPCTISQIKVGESWKDVSVDGISAEDLLLKNNKSGVNNVHSKLTIEDVINIKVLLAAGKLTQRQIGSMFNVSHNCIGGINRGKSYKDIVIPKNYDYYNTGDQFEFAV